MERGPESRYKQLSIYFRDTHIIGFMAQIKVSGGPSES